METTEKVARLVEFATGERYGDGEMVTDVITGYAEPGYGPADAVIALGNWNPKRFPRDGEAPLTSTESLPARLAAALERVGAEVEWSDEWTSCRECHRAIRTQPDSYSWMPSYLWTDDGPVCHTDAIAGGEDYLTEYINNPGNAVTWCTPSHVESFGFVKWAPGDEHTYENGWHPGQTDDPEVIHGAILESHPDAEVLFFLDEQSQFYVTFSAYVRIPELIV